VENNSWSSRGNRITPWNVPAWHHTRPARQHGTWRQPGFVTVLGSGSVGYRAELEGKIWLVRWIFAFGQDRTAAGISFEADLKPADQSFGFDKELVGQVRGEHS